MKQGETLALNERIMLSLVSTGHDCPFIVCMTYAFHTPDKLCFILDLMNGGDLHYHLSQVGGVKLKTRIFTFQHMNLSKKQRMTNKLLTRLFPKFTYNIGRQSLS